MRGASENQLKPQAEDCRRIYGLRVHDGCPGRVDTYNVFLGTLDDLYVRPYLHPGRYGDIVVRLNPLLVPQGLPGRKGAGERGARDIYVIVANATAAEPFLR